MTKKINVKNIALSCLACLVLACVFCLFSGDALAAVTADCVDGVKKCYPACKYNRVESCTLCPIFALVFNTVSKVGALSVENFSSSITQVVVVGFAIWLAFEVMKFVASMKTKDLKDFVQALITKGFIVMIVLIILKAGVGNFYNIFIQPVYNTAQSMAQMLFEDKSNVGSHESDKKAQRDKSISELKEIKNGLPSSMGASIIKTMTMMENRVRKINALGSSMLCQSWQDRFLIFPKIRPLIFGLAVSVLTIMIIIAVPFIMIDSVFQLGVATALMPFAIGGYPFEYTKQYSKKVWDTFLNSAFSFLFTSVVVLILLGALQTSVQTSAGNIEGFEEMFSFNSTTGDAAYSTFKTSANWLSGTSLNLFFTFMLAWSVMNMGKDFAKKFAKSMSNTNIGSQLGARAVSSAKGMAGKALAPAGNVVKNVTQKAAGRIREGTRNIVAQARTARFNRKFAGQNLTTAADGSQTVSGKLGNVFTKDANGNITRSRQRERMLGGGMKKVVERKEIRTKNGVLNIKTTSTMKLENGKWVVVDTKSDKQVSSAAGIMNANGSINLQAMEKLLEGTSGETRELMKNTAIQQITQSRLSKSAFDPSKEKLAKPAETYTDKDGSVVTKYTTASGEVVISKTKLRADGLAESTFSRVAKNGRVTTLQTDGVRCKASFKLLSGEVDTDRLNSIEDIDSSCKRDENGKIIEDVGYSYTDYYQQQINSGNMKESDVPDGMFNTKGSDGITRDEYGEVVKDANGNSVGGAFKRYRKGVSDDSMLHLKDLDVFSLADKDKRKLREGQIFKGGNNYDAMEANMNHFFKGSSGRIKGF